MFIRLVALSALVGSTLVPATATSALPAEPPGPADLKMKQLPRPERQPAKAASYDPHTVLVRFKPGASAAARDAALRSRSATKVRTIGGYVKVRTLGSATDLLRRLKTDATVETATLDYARTKAAVPNDPGYTAGYQRNLDVVRLPAAWDVTKGSTSQVIAVLDTGVDVSHEDLVGRTVAGFNVIDGDANVADIDGHGTMVAGIAAANTNNGKGIAGAAWTGRIMPVRVFATPDSAFDSDIATGVRWAADHGASIINLSLGGPGEAPLIQDAITYATGLGSLVVVAAGNSGATEPNYPAAYPEVLAVGATDNAGRLTDFSTSGDWVDVAAPGFDITSPYFDPATPAIHDYYATGSGTSFSAPLVAGIAALVRTQSPSLRPDQVLQRLKQSTRDAGVRGIDPFYGHGFLDAYTALGGARIADLSGPAADHNDTPARATALTSTATGTITSAGDVDWYRVSSASARAVRVTATPEPFDPLLSQNNDPVIDIYDADLRSLKHVDDFLFGPETLDASLPSGTSYVAVRNFNGSSDSRPYTVTVATIGSATNDPKADVWVRDVSPENIGLQNSLAGSPTVTFPRQLEPASVTDSTVQLVDGRTGQPVPAGVTYDAAARQATITPTAPLADLAPYRIMVGAVQELGGATNTAPVSTTFRADVLPAAAAGFDATGWWNSATLRWSLPSLNDFNQVIVRRSTGGAPPASPTEGVAVYTGTGTSATASGLGWGVTYVFRIWVKDRAGQLSPPAETRLGGSRTGLAVSTTALTYGGSVTLKGRLLKADGTGAIAGAPLRLYARQKGTASWRLLRTATTDSAGWASFVYKPSFGNDFQWRWYSGSPDLIGSGSNIAGVGVRPVVSAYVSRTTLPLGGTVSISGGVSPNHSGQAVVLQRYLGSNRWGNVSSAKLSSASIYKFTLKPAARGSYSYRVVRAADADHLVGVSPTRSFRVS